MIRYTFIFKNLLKHKFTNSLNPPNVYTLIIQRPFSKKPQSLPKKNQNQEPLYSLFKSYGLSEPLVSKLIIKNTRWRTLTTLDTIKPKLEFLTSVGFTHTDLSLMLSFDPFFLNFSLHTSIIPSYQFLMSILKDNGSVVTAIKQYPRLLTQDRIKHLVQNMELLRDYGVPEGNILICLKTQPSTLSYNIEWFRELVGKIKGMGFDPKKGTFVKAVRMIGMNEGMWNRKCDIYRKWGCSNDEIISGFRRQPLFMGVSEEKLERLMEFLVNEMGWDAKEVAGCPNVVLHSLENWTIPRCLVVRFLMSKGVIIKKDLSLTAVILVPEERFLTRFVGRYCGSFPEVLDLYKRPKDSDVSEMQATGLSNVGKTDLLTS